ncbi:class I SAM-dependent RNA methyltransferase [Rhodohalobacter sp. SW132]|uniref:THUMP domain-containing class I SAM-dependent RNA methyltransferase n=1 Tax=Rhodohalobacter sp. SW132 TaxID=2293433 RepID=UPI000E2635CB|nr:class I SAM-dependent RNA methyltransferase [Rhodohalobacter sp. SW132]REL24250.1 class I SAM-dependent RNA methyltransferase [Rhodohalobacter sp. SW132]
MTDFSTKRTVRVTCPLGLSLVLENELRDLGFMPGKTDETGIELKASLEETISLNFHLRTAHRVYVLVDQTVADTPDKLTEWLKEIPWEEWIPADGYVSVTSRVNHSKIENSQFANLTCKDAVVDRMRDQNGFRPDSGSDLNKTVLFLYWTDDEARIFMDTSGESLSRRNYRTESASAPMRETLAAAIIKATDWKPGDHFINPMAGGGTLAIEAALIATNRAPASLRNNFGFMHIKGFDPEKYHTVRDEAKQNVKKEISGEIIASDIDPQAMDATRKNAQTAGVEHLIRFETCDVAETPVPEGPGVIVMNPPYGIRLEPGEDLRPLYKKMGDFLKQEGPGKTGYIFTANSALAKKVGLRTKSRTTFFNTTLECRLLEYELYSGSK